jgi:DNA polymerase-1
MHALIDSDSLLYRAGFVVNEPGQEALACWQLDGVIEGILSDIKVDSYQLYLTGSGNFRYKIYPEYKGQRVGMKRPIHLQALTEHCVTKWGATVSDGNEADDEVGIAAYKAEDEVLICHIDKDLDMLAGQHYNYTKKEFYSVSNEEAIRHFYFQLIMGDKADNIPGYDGKMRTKVPQFLYSFIADLDDCDSQEEMLALVSEKWDCNDDARWSEFNQAAHCLWMQRKPEDDWRNHLNDFIMGDLGLPVELIRSLPSPWN